VAKEKEMNVRLLVAFFRRSLAKQIVMTDTSLRSSSVLVLREHILRNLTVSVNYEATGTKYTLNLFGYPD
jgi:hypothetical protein